MKLFLAALLLLTAPALAGDIVGRADVVDGDTIDIGKVRIRLDGVDAPESWQTCHDAGGKLYRCGARAAEALDALLAASRPTRCRQVDTDRYGRVVAVPNYILDKVRADFVDCGHRGHRNETRQPNLSGRGQGSRAS